MAAPWMALSPTPPAPKTTTLLPGVTCAVLKTAPTPVITAQPSSAHLSRGASAGSLTAALAGTTTSSAMAPTAEKTHSSCPPWRTRVEPSGMRLVLLICSPTSQRCGLPIRQ